MKNTPALLLAHMQSDTTTLATLWKLKRKDGQIFGFTDLDVDITYNDGTGLLTYLASTGFTPSSVEATSELSVDNLEIQGVLDASTITENDLIAGKWDRADVCIYRVNYMDLTMGHEWLNRGFLGNVTSGRNAFQAEIRGLTQSLQQSMARAVLPLCPHTFCDTKCGLNAATYTYSGTVTGVVSNQTFGTDLTNPIDTFAKGKITWLTGANAGLEKDIKFFSGMPDYSTLTHTGVVSGGSISVAIPSGKTFASNHGLTDSTGRLYSLADSPSSGGTYSVSGSGVYSFNAEDEGKTMIITYAVQEFLSTVAGQIDLQLEMPYDVQVGDTFTAIAGCNKLFSKCQSYTNVINFGGFPHLPGRDHLVTGGK